MSRVASGVAELHVVFTNFGFVLVNKSTPLRAGVAFHRHLVDRGAARGVYRLADPAPFLVQPFARKYGEVASV